MLIGTIGYHNLRNHSIGPLLLPKLRQMPWPDHVVVEELNWGPIAIVQYFQSLPEPYQQVVILTAVERAHRSPGEITLYRWEGGLPSDKQIQACIGDAVTGVISIDNLLIIGEYFKIWPRQLFIVDVEPGRQQTGEQLTPEVEAQVPTVLNTIQNMVLGQNNEQTPIQCMYGNNLIAES